MKKQGMDGIFVLREEDACPLHGDDRQDPCSRDGQIVLPVSKSSSLALDDLFLEFQSLKKKQQRAGHHIVDSAVYFDCRGRHCEGSIYFELKKKRGKFFTAQMKMLAAAERRSEVTENSALTKLISEADIFQALSEDDLAEIETLFSPREYPPLFPVIVEDSSSPRLALILSGRVKVVDADGLSLVEFGPGDIFGLLSLLATDSVRTSVVTLDSCRVAEMTQENFHSLLKMFPAICLPLFALVANRVSLVSRVQAQSSALQGQLVEMPFSEICQLLHSIKKTGRLEIDEGGSGGAYLSFSEGELVAARYKDLVDIDAFNALLGLDQGRFYFSQGLSAEERALQPIDSFMKLLFDGVRRLDEDSESL